MEKFRAFLSENWTTNISDLEEKIAILKGTTIPPKVDKAFYKHFDLFFHTKETYDQLLSSLEELHETLVQAHNLYDIDVQLEPHPLARMISAEMKPAQTLKASFEDDDVKRNHPTADNIQKLKRLLVQALGTHLHKLNTKESILKTKRKLTKKEIEQKNTSIKEEKNAYETYAKYLYTGARHNELVSRVYPWEISGIEWGGNDTCKVEGVSSLLTVLMRRAELSLELEFIGTEHPLFHDFLINKLSIENPHSSYSEVLSLVDAMQKNNPSECKFLLHEIKSQLQQPIQIYEYSPVERKMINISRLVAAFQNRHSLTETETKSEPKISNALDQNPELLEKAEACNKLFNLGIIAFKESTERYPEKTVPDAEKGHNLESLKQKLSDLKSESKSNNSALKNKGQS